MSNAEKPTLLLNFVQAGFPAPGDDLEGRPLDTNQLLVRNPAATFFMRVSGSSMQDIGIYDGDIVVVDKSIESRDGDIVVAVLNGSYTLKTLAHINGTPRLVAKSKTHKSIDIEQGDELVIWGVVTFVLRSVRHTL